MLFLLCIFFVSDYTDIIKSRDEYYKEQLVRMQEINIVRDKLKWCYRREGVNHFQNCRHLSMQYMDLLKQFKGGWIQPYERPIKESTKEAAEDY